MTGRPLDQTPVDRLSGVGPKMKARLADLGIESIQDLLFHLPYRYEDRTRITPIGQAFFGDCVQVQGEIVDAGVQFGRRRSFRCVVSDGTGMLSIRFYHFNAMQQNRLAVGKLIRCYGEVRYGRSGIEMYHPEYRILSGVAEADAVPDSLTPVYPTTEGVHQNRIRKLVQQALEMLARTEKLPELLPAHFLRDFGGIDLAESVRLLHEPPADLQLNWSGRTDNSPARRRLAFEELLAHRICMRRLKLDASALQSPRFGGRQALLKRFAEILPFKLTDAQRKVYREIRDDLSGEAPMMRLVQGDVGSGKTVVAALAALHAIESGFQVSLMAPTEILAEQHLHTFRQWFENLPVRIGWLSGKTRAKARKQVLEDLAGGNCDLLIGTHAVFQESVEYQRLGLIIVDEQHRFGVHQRLALREKAGSGSTRPHQLVMTATPIPRTLAMSAYADLDCSVIDELPPGRSPVNTVVFSNERRARVMERIASACGGGRQAYWVCTLIDDSETLQAQAAEATADQLREALPGIRVGLVHGRLKPAEKAEVMDGFKHGEIQLLVATTVIEVGVDVPNASLMVIENPERLGLAQLHQLRGRVGRGAEQSHCLLLYQPPLSELSQERLRIVRESNDGFLIAEEDLRLRGPGQLLGTRQTGLMSFKVADISRDSDMLEQVRDTCDELLNSHPEVAEPLIRRWLGESSHYADV